MSHKQYDLGESGDLTLGFRRPVSRDKCEDALWDVQHELVSYAFLLRGLGPSADSCEDLYGLGLALDRMARRVARTAERLSQSKKLDRRTPNPPSDTP